MNVAYPDQTPEQAEDLQLEAWAALQVYSLRKGWVTRGRVEHLLNHMGEQKQQRARHWLNVYRGKSAE
ncbi:hypothetical protein [Oceanimonas smirnovii]|uniref:hypothetical protein n=1 Tax=Oceanimonas smirnovii TaxID=264574 RepID=UPI003FCF6C59